MLMPDLAKIGLKHIKKIRVKHFFYRNITDYKKTIFINRFFFNFWYDFFKINFALKL